MNIGGYALRPPRGPKDAMPRRHESESATVVDAKKEQES
ncbi:MAG: hypothetical protein K0Q71_6299 [Thermomicrobiales bacterium]|nr:hypothetical protein [Thermomicrobiales bacterium]